MDYLKSKAKLQFRVVMPYIRTMAAITTMVALSGCSFGGMVKGETSVPKLEASTGNYVLAANIQNRDVLSESWQAYRHKFIQADGRVIDYQASDRSTSEGQAYAMLRSLLINDPTTFDLTLKWSENNLQRKEGNRQTDHLWCWKWGRNALGIWEASDRNFATDADIDATTALILASRLWRRPEYLQLAKVKLQDLWNLSTAVGAGGKRYLLPGPADAFTTASALHLNPSYLAPYAFRLFAQVDSDHNWLSLVDTSYEVLENSSRLSAVGLPSDWVSVDKISNKYEPLSQPDKPSAPQSLYSYDAYRVWWRVSLDAAWFNSPQARRYLETASQHLQHLWYSQSRLPASIDLQGKALVNYEATSQYAMLYAAMRLTNTSLANELLQKKLLPQYKQGIWDDQSAYYTQNLAWLGLVPPSVIPAEILTGK